MVKRAIITHFGRFTNHNTHPVVNEDATADLGTRVNFNPRQKAPRVRKNTGSRQPTLNPTPPRHTMNHDRMETGISKNHFPTRMRGRVFLHNRGN